MLANIADWFRWSSGGGDGKICICFTVLGQTTAVYHCTYQVCDIYEAESPAVANESEPAVRRQQPLGVDSARILFRFL